MQKTIVSVALSTMFVAVTSSVFGFWIHSALFPRIYSYDSVRKPAMDSINVSAEATVKVPINYALVHLVVEQRNPTNPAIAKRETDEDVRSILSQCEKYEIKPKDVDGSEVFVGPETNWDEAKRYEERIGYLARRSIVIRVQGTKRLDPLLTELSTLKSAIIKGVAFRNDDPEKAYDLAFRTAMSNATKRAEALVKSAGYELGVITAISDDRDVFLMCLRSGAPEETVKVDEKTSFTTDSLSISAKATMSFSVRNPKDEPALQSK